MFGLSERRQAKRSSFAGDEHECIEQNENLVSQGRGQVVASDAVCQSGTRATRLRPNSNPTRQRRLASDVGDTRSVRSAARSSQRTAGGESPHGANGVTTKGARSIRRAPCGRYFSVGPLRAN